MQQYRVNYPLLIGLVVGTFVFSGAVFALWKFQVERKSGWLINEAEKALAEGDNRQAVEYFGQYLSIQNDEETQIKYAKSLADLAKSDDVEPQEFHMAWQTLEGVIRDPKLGNAPESNELRLALTKMYALMRRFPDALYHVDYLLDQNPKDGELHVLKATYLVGSGKFDEAIKYYYKLLGYDPEAKTFDVDKAIAPHDTKVYTDLARLVRTRNDDKELANRVMDQLIEVNSDSAEAYLARGQYLNNAGDDSSAGRPDIEKAYELKPKDADVLLAMAIQAAQTDAEEDADAQSAAYDKAGEYLKTGKELFPEDFRFYQVAADIEIRRRKYDEALAQIDEGLKKIGTKKASLLLLFKADLQLNEDDMVGVRQTIDDMKRDGFRSEFVDWYLARVMLNKNEWFDAKEALNRLRPRVADDPNPWPLNLRDIDFYLGLCEERLGRLDAALDQYELVLDMDPENESAIAAKKRVSVALDPGTTASDAWQQQFNEELKKPREQRDWAKVDKMLDEQAKANKLDNATRLVYRANILMMREDFDGAARALDEANKASPNDSPRKFLVHRMAIQLARLNPKVGPQQALATWDKVNKQFGDQAELRLDKADILMALKKDKPEELRSELAGLLQGIDGWKVPQKVMLWSGMAARYLNLGMTDEARAYWTLSAEQQPNELPLRLQLFQLALADNDDAGMQEAQKKILEIVNDRDDSTYLYTEARRKLAAVRRGELEKSALAEVRLLVDRALEQRRDWHELFLVDAEVELVDGNLQQALTSFDEAAKRGLPNPLAMAMYIDLLAKAGRFNDAATQLQRLPEPSRQALLGPLYTDILFRTNQVANALEQARQAAEKDPTNAQNHFWYSQILARSSMAPQVTEQQRKESLNKAIAAMQKVVELQPESADAWFFLINLYATQKEIGLAQQALRDAQLALSSDNLQLFLARSYESLGSWFDAETMYRAVYETAPDEIARAQRLAEFYLGQGYQRPDRATKVTPLINQILHAAAEGKIESNDASLQWARRMAAKILAASGDYQNLIKAETLLSANSQGGELLVQDKLEKAQILASRFEPASRKRAIALLQEVEKIQPLDERSEITLGKLYHATGNWTDYAKQMDETVVRYQKSAAAREEYARKLLARGDKESVDKATRQVGALRELAPNSTAAFELTVRLANKLGRQQQARAELVRLLPKVDPSKGMTPPQEGTLVLFGKLFVELDDLDNAEKVYRYLASLDASKSYSLAMFLGLHRGVDQCFEQLKQGYEVSRLPDILGVALHVVREKRDQVGDKYDADMQGWLDRGLLNDPDSISLLMLQADLYDIQKRYEDAAAIYQKLLARRELVGVRRAIVLNNLSFLVSLAGSAAKSNVDPLKLANEAADILGPSSDILDTRAVALIYSGQYSRAIEDLRDAVTDNPTPSKYFHLAWAYLGANEKRSAIGAWEAAEKLGLSREVLNRMEHSKYDDLKRQIDQARPGGASVTQNESLRRN